MTILQLYSHPLTRHFQNVSLVKYILLGGLLLTLPESDTVDKIL